MLSEWLKKQSSLSLVLYTNIFEFLDLYLFIHFGWLINKIFLKGWSAETIQYVTFLAIYGVAPISCVCLSYLGDLYGRKPILLNTAVLMGFVSLAIIALPVETHPDAAAFGLLALRVIQGIALGGEPMGAYLFAIEEKKDIRDATFYVFIMRITEILGGLLALFYGCIVIGFLGEEYWRLLFAIISLFIFVAYFLRKHLQETSDYKEFLSNARIGLEDYFAIKEIYKVRQSKNRNYVAGFLLWLSYPVMFAVCYLFISPYVCQRMGWVESSIIYYNFIIFVGEALFSFLLAYWVLYCTKVNVRIAGMVANAIGLAITSLLLVYLEDLSIVTVAIGQIALMVLVNYGWILPDVFKNFSVIGRYTAIGNTWALARFISFFTCTIVISTLVKWYGLGLGSLILVLIVNAFCLLSFFIMIPYSQVQRELGYE